MTKVIYYTTENGENPVDEFLNSLQEKQQGKLLRIIDYIKIYGLDSAIPHLKRLTGTPLWEIRILGQDNIRVFYATIQHDSVLFLHGFVKKTQKTARKEIAIALIRWNEWQKSGIKID